MTTVAPVDISKPVRRGAEWRLRLNVKTPSGAAQDIGSDTSIFTCTLRTGEAKDATVVLTPTKTVVSAAGGIIDFSLTPTQMLTPSTGLDYWVSVYVNASWTNSIDRLEAHGRLDIIG